jgi:hypothetical protein
MFYSQAESVEETTPHYQVRIKHQLHALMHNKHKSICLYSTNTTCTFHIHSLSQWRSKPIGEPLMYKSRRGRISSYAGVSQGVRPTAASLRIF